MVRRAAIVVGVALTVVLGAAGGASAGPGCPDMPGVCPGCNVGTDC